MLAAGMQVIPQIIQQNKLTQVIYWKKHRRVAAFAQETSRKELRQAYVISGQGALSKVC